MFAKFLVGCLALAALLIIGGTYLLKSETQMRSRGNYLAKGVRRLAGYVERVGQGMTGTLEILSADPELRAALAPAPGETEPEARARRVEAVGRRMLEQLTAKNGLGPDLFAIFSPTNELLFTIPRSPLVQPELPQLGVVTQARSGSVVAHRVQMLRGVPYQVSALPVELSKTSD